MNRAARLVTLAIGLLAALLSVVQPASAVDMGHPPTVIGHTYDGHHHSAFLTCADAEGGSPAADSQFITTEADSLPLLGGSACTCWRALEPTTTYNAPAKLVQVVRATGTTPSIARADERALSLATPTGVAAKSADDVLPGV